VINWVERLTGETRARLLGLLRRSQQTVNRLADALGLTDNAVRTHIAGLSRDGLVKDVGAERDTGGKPARVYALTKEGEELFPKAYAFVLGELVEEIARNDGRERAVKFLRAVGERAAAGAAATPLRDNAARVEAAATMLRDLGGDIEVQRTDAGWRLQGYGCPLSAATAQHPEVCAVAQALVEQITGRRVTECCDRSERPRCAFEIVEA
jgi:predicted ArsR family transcriptional regulator